MNYQKLTQIFLYGSSKYDVNQNFDTLSTTITSILKLEKDFGPLW